MPFNADKRGDKLRGSRKYFGKKKEKKERKLRNNNGFQFGLLTEISLISKRTGDMKYVEVDEFSLKSGHRDRIRNVGNYQARSRTESPPPKHRRSKKGFNSGSFCGCSHCRPAIANRVSKVAEIRHEIASIRKEQLYN